MRKQLLHSLQRDRTASSPPPRLTLSRFFFLRCNQLLTWVKELDHRAIIHNRRTASLGHVGENGKAGSDTPALRELEQDEAMRCVSVSSLIVTVFHTGSENLNQTNQ